MGYDLKDAQRQWKMFIFSAIGEIFGHSVALPYRAAARRTEWRVLTAKEAGIGLVHGVAKLDEGLVGVGEADEAQTGIFDL